MDRPGGTPTMKPQDLATRRTDITNAFLAHRLSKAQLNEMARHLEDGEQQWSDRFTALTDRKNSGTDFVDHESFQKTVNELGLPQRFESLSDDVIWTREERALYRRFAYEPVDSLKASVIQVDENYGEIFLETAEVNFHDWDRNGDLRVDARELDLLMSGGYYGELAEIANNPVKAATLSTLRRYQDLIQSAYPHDGEGVSNQDLVSLRVDYEKGARELFDLTGESLAGYQQKLMDVDLSKPLTQEKIDPFSIHQGTAGSCVFLSAAAGSTTDRLNSLITLESESSYRVQFADGASEIVNEPTTAERLYHSKGENMDRWPAILEIALAQRLMTEREGRNYGSLRDAIDGISPELAIKALTNKEIDQRSLDELTVNQTRAVLGELMSREGPKICATRPTAASDFISVEDLHNGLMSGHAYTLLNYDAESDKVTLRNPWGHKEWIHQQSEDDGIFEMPVRDFYSSFRWVAAPQDEATPPSITN